MIDFDGLKPIAIEILPRWGIYNITMTNFF